MIVAGHKIEALGIITPFHGRTVAHGLTYGVGPAGYDIRIAQSLELRPGDFRLASTLEHFTMPDHVLGRIHDKSTWARRGIAVQNTIFEPGWIGFGTIEITNHSAEKVFIPKGAPIAQIIFEYLDEPAKFPYRGKYQNQPDRPVEAIMEKGE